MATFGEMINLQPYILNWLVNGENENLAQRALTRSSAVYGNKVKNTYEGNYQDFLNNYLIPNSSPSMQSSGGYGVFNGTTSNVTWDTVTLPDLSTETGDIVVEFEMRTTATAVANYPVVQIGTDAEGGGGVIFMAMQSEGGDMQIFTPPYGGTSPVTPSVVLNDGEWHKVVVSTPLASDADKTCFVDDVEQFGTFGTGPGVLNWGAAISSPGTLVIGAFITEGLTHFFDGDLRNVKVSIGENVLLDVSDPSTGTNAGVLVDGVATDVTQVPGAGVTEYFVDRTPYSKRLSRGKLLSSLVEYKNRWNVNKDSATLKIDYIGFKGDKLVVKTTEDLQSPLKVVAFTPIDGATEVDASDYVLFEFSEDIEFATTGKYSVTFYDYDSDTLNNELSLIDGTPDPGLEIINNNTLRVSPFELSIGTKVYFLIDEGIVTSVGGGKVYAGIADKDAYTFTTAEGGA